MTTLPSASEKAVGEAIPEITTFSPARLSKGARNEGYDKSRFQTDGLRTLSYNFVVESERAQSSINKARREVLRNTKPPIPAEQNQPGMKRAAFSQPMLSKGARNMTTPTVTPARHNRKLVVLVFAMAIVKSSITSQSPQMGNAKRTLRQLQRLCPKLSIGVA